MTSTMRLVPILTVLSAAAVGFLIGVSFPVAMSPKLRMLADGGAGNSSIVGRFWPPFGNTSMIDSSSITSEAVEVPKGSERRLPPGIVVSESDLHLRRLWGSPSEDGATGKYLLALSAGYAQRVNVNATIQKFPAGVFDLVVFHYDGRTSEWDEEFEWSRSRAVHVSGRKQSKWWFAKRFLHPAVVAPYEYVFVWDEDLGVETFDAEEYIRIVRRHGLEISQPGLDLTRGTKTYDVNVRRNATATGEEVHRKDVRCREADWGPPCSGFVEVMAPVFSRDAWRCVWHLIQNDLVHAWGLDFHLWRCVDNPKEQMGIVDAQYVAHHGTKTLQVQGEGEKDGSSAKVNARQRAELHTLDTRIADAVKDLANATGKPPRKCC